MDVVPFLFSHQVRCALLLYLDSLARQVVRQEAQRGSCATAMPQPFTLTTTIPTKPLSPRGLCMNRSAAGMVGLVFSNSHVDGLLVTGVQLVLQVRVFCKQVVEPWRGLGAAMTTAMDVGRDLIASILTYTSTKLRYAMAPSCQETKTPTSPFRLTRPTPLSKTKSIFSRLLTSTLCTRSPASYSPVHVSYIFSLTFWHQ